MRRDRREQPVADPQRVIPQALQFTAPRAKASRTGDRRPNHRNSETKLHSQASNALKERLAKRPFALLD
jgi:hypothetical protein